MTKINYNQLKALPLLLTFNFLLLTCFAAFSQSGAAINTTGAAAHSSAILDVSSDNAGMLIPRMTKTQRSGITLPAEGLLIYQTNDTVGFWYHSGGVWKVLGNGTGSAMPTGSNTGNTLYWDGSAWVESSNIFNGGTSVGIGTNSPEPTALIDMSSTTKGALIPRMTIGQRNAIQTPAEGLQIFNADTKCFEFYADNMWQKTFCSFNCGVDSIIDLRDGNIYKTVQIGSQCWMRENLNYDNNSGNSWCYGGTPGNCTTYGRLYTWDVATIACPLGWHLPSDAEWTQLTDYLSANFQYVCGSSSTQIAKSLASTTLWNTNSTTCAIGNNLSNNNSSGFTALPGGFRHTNLTFYNIGDYCFWWSATEDGSNAWRRYLNFNNANVSRNSGDKGFGYAVRCLRD